MSTTAIQNPRKWYVLRTFSGHEKKVKEAIEREVERLGYEDRVGQIFIPTETVFEVRAGKKRQREKTSYPGYLLVEVHMDPHLRDLLTGLPSVVGFLTTGGGKDPVPLRPDEVERLIRPGEGPDKPPEMPFKVGDAVKVVDGPFNNFSGFVEEVYPDKLKVRVMVSIFGRKTPLELDYLQIEPEP